MKATVTIVVTYDNDSVEAKSKLKNTLNDAVQHLADEDRFSDGTSKVTHWKHSVDIVDTDERREQVIYCDTCFDGKDELPTQYTGVLPLNCAKCRAPLQVGHAHYVQRRI